jgi:Ser/Thr protein kinase RdoA (MazF antagonist)
MERMRAVDALYLALDVDAGDLVVPFLRTNNGGIFVEIEGNAWVSMRYVRHDSDFDWKQPSWKVEHCAAAAKGLAHFHAGAQSVLIKSKRVQEMLPPSPIEQIPMLVRTLYARFDQEEHDAEILNFLLPVRVQLLAEAEGSVQSIRAAEVNADLVPTVLHGDFHPGNCLFRGEQLRAIIDFEYVHRGSPIFDLAYGGVMFGTNWNARAADAAINVNDNALIERDFLKRFVSAYRMEARAYNSLGNPDLLDDDDYLDHCLRLSYVLVLLWCCEQTQNMDAATDYSAYRHIAEIAIACMQRSEK